MQLKTKNDNAIPRKLHLFVNQECNLRCEYCYWQGKHEKKEISYTVVNKIIEFINNNPDLYDYIVFFGGEPMLAAKKIAYIINNINNPKMVYIIMTNGTIHPNILIKKLDKKIYEYRIDFTISYDGLYQKGRNINPTLNSLILKHVSFLKQNSISYTIGCILSPKYYQLITDNMIYILDNLADSAIFFRICNLDAEWNNQDLTKHIKDFKKIVDIATYYTVLKNKLIWLSNRIDKPETQAHDNINGSKGNTCQKSLVYTDICGLNGKKYLCEPAYALNCGNYGYLWEQNDTYAVEWDQDKRHHDCTWHYCLLYKTQNIDYEAAMDKMRDKYNKRKKKLENIKNAKITYLKSFDEDGRMYRLAEDYFRNRQAIL